MTRILVIRHGESVWNAAGRWQGRADQPLTERGRHQARTAATALPAFDVLAASPLQRAQHTAEEMAAVVGTSDVVLQPGLMERDAGEFSGLTRTEIDEQFPGYLQNGIWPDGWEDDQAILTRVNAALDALVAMAPGGTVVAIAHGGVIYALENLFGIAHQRVGNLAGRWFRMNGAELDVGDRVHLLDAATETVPDQL